MTASQVTAGGLSQITIEPTAPTPATNEFSWQGAFAGLGLTHGNSSRTETEERVTGTREVIELAKPRGVSDGSTVDRDRITSEGISEFDGETILRISSTADQIVIIRKAGSGNAPQVVEVKAGVTRIVVDGQGTYIAEFESGKKDTKATGPQNFPDTTTTIFPIIETIENMFNDPNAEINVFAGYRHLNGNGTFVGGEFGTIGGAEIQFGLAAEGNPWATYIGANTDGELTLGADRLMGANGNWFVGGKLAHDGEDLRAEVRTGVKFQF